MYDLTKSIKAQDDFCVEKSVKKPSNVPNLFPLNSERGFTSQSQKKDNVYVSIDSR